MAYGNLIPRELTNLRRHRAWWWAVWSTPVCHLALLATLVGAAVLAVRPDALVAQIVLAGAALMVGAAVAKTTAVEVLVNRWVDRRRKHRLRSDIRELNRLQVHRETRRDAYLGIGAFLKSFVKESLGI